MPRANMVSINIQNKLRRGKKNKNESVVMSLAGA